jgi:hypothetical protein
MRAASSPLDRPAARAIAAAIGLLALAGAGWLIYLDNRQDPALLACIKRHSAAIAAARDKGALPPAVAARFLAHVAQSCRAQIDRDSR